MKFSLALPIDHIGADFVGVDAVREMSQAAETLGYDALNLTDHPAPSAWPATSSIKSSEARETLGRMASGALPALSGSSVPARSAALAQACCRNTPARYTATQSYASASATETGRSVS